MSAVFAQVADHIALVLQMLAVLFIALGALEAVATLLRPILTGGATQGRRRAAWLSFARWLVLALEFTLAADIVATAIAPDWNDIGQLAAIAAIRTFLNYFLERDLRSYQQETV